jgi:hypothetical protein
MAVSPPQAPPEWHPFDSAADNPDSSLLVDLSAESDVLLIAFGGIKGQLGMPPFEFFNVVGKLDFPVKRAFVRDLRRAWYHQGTPGLGDTIDEMKVALSGVIEEAVVRRVVTVGNSAGGYAAILFGILLGVDRAIGFSPPTSLDPDIRRSIGVKRALGRLRVLADSGGPDPRYADLRGVLRSMGHGHVDIHYAADDPLDVIQAQRVADVPRVRIYEHRGGRHELVRRLRDDGSLLRLLAAALADGSLAPARYRRSASVVTTAS